MDLGVDEVYPQGLNNDLEVSPCLDSVGKAFGFETARGSVLPRLSLRGSPLG